MYPKAIEKLPREGINLLYDDPSSVEERMLYELETINRMGFTDYFLIVADFVQYARNNGVMVGPGRGSAAGSIVAYALRITDIDPIKWGLLFERFLNPERVSMPDIDIDFCDENRDKVIEYVTEKYGHDKYRWIDNVEKYVLLKSKPEYYNDSVCRNGYFRGLETYNFVREIRARHNIYKEKIKE